MTDRWTHARLQHRSEQGRLIAGAALGLLIDRGAGALSMAAVAEAAEVSRPTLYRYYGDIDAVLAGIADLVASHDAGAEEAARSEPDPAARLDRLLEMVAGAVDHARATTALRAALPPASRDVLSSHENRIRGLLRETLAAGVESGAFRRDLSPEADARLLLGLALAAHPGDARRVVALVHRLVDPTPQEAPS